MIRELIISVAISGVGLSGNKFIETRRLARNPAGCISLKIVAEKQSQYIKASDAWQATSDEQIERYFLAARGSFARVSWQGLVYCPPSFTHSLSTGRASL